MTEDMKDEYDFSKGERGKFYRPGVDVTMPVRLDDDVVNALVARAEARGIDFDTLVNEILRKDIARSEAAE
jgi:predicted DNA binding CopG/RHH family protein